MARTRTRTPSPDRTAERTAPVAAAAPLAPSADAENGGPEFTVDELSAAAGVPTRTIRHYQAEKVLPPPRKRGRIAVYAQHHLERLRLIAQLQDRGLSLKAIRDALRQVERGNLALEDWLGLGDELRRPWSEDAPALLSGDELAERLAGRRPGLLAALLETGVLVEQQSSLSPAYLVPSRGLLEIALQLEAAGVDVEVSARAGSLMRKHLHRAADDLVAYFLDNAGDGFGHGPAELAVSLEALRPLGVEAIRLIFANEVERALRKRIGDVAPALGRQADAADARPSK